MLLLVAWERRFFFLDLAPYSSSDDSAEDSSEDEGRREVLLDAPAVAMLISVKCALINANSAAIELTGSALALARVRSTSRIATARLVVVGLLLRGSQLGQKTNSIHYVLPWTAPERLGPDKEARGQLGTRKGAQSTRKQGKSG